MHELFNYGIRTGKHVKKIYPYWGHSILSPLSLQQSANFSVSGVSEMLVSADVIAKRSVKDSLK